MAVFSVNQNRQLYVAKTCVDTTPDTLGEIKVGVTANGKQVYFQHYGKGGLTRSDLIDVDKIEYAKITPAENLAYYLKKCTVALNPNINDGDPLAGQDYILRVYIDNYLGFGDDNTTAKYGMVHTYPGMTAETFYEILAKSLTANFSKEVTPLLTFEATSDGVVITEVEQPWVPGTMSQEHVRFRPVGAIVSFDGDEIAWAANITLEDTDTKIGDGKKIADLEWFCHGERGDQYRGMGWPNVIHTQYEVDPTAEYDVLDLHYSFVDTGVNIQKSEKDITIVSTDSGVLESIQTLLEGYGVTFEETASSDSDDSEDTDSDTTEDTDTDSTDTESTDDSDTADDTDSEDTDTDDTADDSDAD